LWLKVFLNNHAVSSTVVVDLTAGSFSSFLACYLSPTPFHWMGGDIAPDSISQWEFVAKNLVASNSPTKTWISKFIQGTTRTPTFLLLIAVNEEEFAWEDLTELNKGLVS
jgi:hypothetical protein